MNNKIGKLNIDQNFKNTLAKVLGHKHTDINNNIGTNKPVMKISPVLHNNYKTPPPPPPPPPLPPPLLVEKNKNINEKTKEEQHISNKNNNTQNVMLFKFTDNTSQYLIKKCMSNQPIPNQPIQNQPIPNKYFEICNKSISSDNIIFIFGIFVGLFIHNVCILSKNFFY